VSGTDCRDDPRRILEVPETEPSLLVCNVVAWWPRSAFVATSLITLLPIGDEALPTSSSTFDNGNRLIGIEVLGASATAPPDLLENARIRVVHEA